MTEKAPHRLGMAREEILQILDQISLFGGLDAAQLNVILELLTESGYSDGEEIFVRGDQPSHIYIVFSGQVRLDFGHLNHPLSNIGFTRGDCFGETSVVGIQPHAATAVAKGETRLLVLSRDVLFRLYETDLPLFALLIMNIAREAARRLHATDQWFLNSVDERS